MRGKGVLANRGRDARFIILRGLLLPLAVSASLWATTGGRAQQAQQNQQNRCVDYGSFGVVDAYPPPRRGEPIVAQPFQPCADLPGQPQPQIFIDAQVQVGGDRNGGGADGGGVGGSPRFGFRGVSPY